MVTVLKSRPAKVKASKKKKKTTLTKKDVVVKKKLAKPLVPAKRHKNGQFLKGECPVINYAWEKGQSGNPKGRPKNPKSVTHKLTDLMDRIPSKLPNGERNRKRLTWADILALKAIFAVIQDGDSSFFKEILNRTEGKVPDIIRHGAEEATPETLEMIRSLFK